MTDSCKTIEVQDPADTVQEAWFKAALQEGHDEQVDAVVVLSHMDVQDECVGVIQRGIRAVRGYEQMPIQFITGHTHYRGFDKVDNFSSSFEAGHYLDTLGWLSFQLARTPDVQETHGDPQGIWFLYDYVDANRDVLMGFTATDKDSFDTPLGLSITQAINDTVTRLGLREVLGCPSMTYDYTVPIDNPDSLYAVYMNQIIPHGVFDVPTGTGNRPYYITSTGSLRYNVYKGEFLYDDVFAVAPFTNKFQCLFNLTGSVISQILVEANKAMQLATPPRSIAGSTGGKTSPDEHAYQHLHNHEHQYQHAVQMRWNAKMQSLTAGDALPSFIGGPKAPQARSVYDMFINEYDLPAVATAAAKVLDSTPTKISQRFMPWRQEGENMVDTTLVWKDGAPAIWPC